MDKLKELGFNDLPKNQVIEYMEQNDEPLFVQSVGRVERFIGGGESFPKDDDFVITVTRTPTRL